MVVSGSRRLLIAACGVLVIAGSLPLLINAGLQLLADAAGSPAPRVFAADSLVYDRSGAEIADLHTPGATRIPVPLTAIAPEAQAAIVAIEDRHFWSEGAVDVQRLAAAALRDIGGGPPQGASTIPMQLVKLLYLSDDRSVSFKVREIALAQRMVETTPKAAILDDYLNDVFFGGGATGIEAASHVYFGIAASRLDLAQAAMLAGLPNAPSAADPVVHPQAARARQVQVLAAMLSSGSISADAAAAAAKEPLHYAPAGADDVDLAPAFVDRAAREVATTVGVDPRVAGLRITSTLDLARQRAAQDSVSTQVAQLAALHVSDGAAVEMDPATGDVLAYVGSAGGNVPGGAYDMAATPRQPGSSFKLFTYATAIATEHVSMVSQVLDGPLHLPSGGGGDGTRSWAPLDYDRSWHGPVPVEEALGNSLNVPAIRVELVTGIPAIVNTARAMGVTTLTASPHSYGPSLTLGAYPVPLWEMAQAAGVFAGGGVLHAARFVLAVTRSDGSSVAMPARAHRVLDPRVAFVMNTMLSDDANRALEFGMGGPLTLPSHVVAAKTGTSETFRDNLTVGWTPHLVTATWVGNADDSAMRGTTGITGAAPIWHDIMAGALGSTADDWPAAPGGLLTADTPWGTAYFLPGTDPQTGEPGLMTIGGGDAGKHDHGDGHDGGGPGGGGPGGGKHG